MQPPRQYATIEVIAFFHYCRLVTCKYEKIGCRWQGTSVSLMDHEGRCAQARKTGIEIMETLEHSSSKEEEKLILYQSLVALLSYGRTSIHGIVIKLKRVLWWIQFFDNELSSA